MVVVLKLELLIGREIIKESLPNYAEVAHRFIDLIGEQLKTEENNLSNYFYGGFIEGTIPIAKNMTGEAYCKQMMTDLILINQSEANFVEKSNLVMGWIENLRIRRLDA